MKHPIAALALVAVSHLVMPPDARAEDAPAPTPTEENAEENSAPLLEDWTSGAERMMREMLEDLRPEMEGMMTEIIPRLRQLGELMGGIANYETPEILPNGDIIIRRKPDAPPMPQDFTPDDAPIDL